MKIHYLDIIEKTSECGGKGELNIEMDKVTCLDCLRLIEQEWKRQVKTFKGSPLRNAKEGLSITKKRIVKVRKR